MEGVLNPVMLSRLQFAWTIAFHIIWPTLTIGLSIFLVLTEALWLRTSDPLWYRHCRFWGKPFLLNFAVGVVTGVVMEFQFGTNWSAFSRVSGDFFGNVLGFEGAMAFAMEAAFLALMMFGWQRVSRGIHMLSTCIVAFAATLSAFWIMDANSWMQTPAGVRLDSGRLVVESYAQAIFNPNLFLGFTHKWFACLQIGLFVVGGLSAWYILRRRETSFFLKSFKIAVIAALVVTPLQVYLGDASARFMGSFQPAKVAAMEGAWETNPPGVGAPWSVVAWPDEAKETNSWDVKVPNLLSLLMTHSTTGQVRGLRDFSPADRPPVAINYYSFRIMVALGFAMFFLMLWTIVVWLRGGLYPENAPARKWLLRFWILAIPASYLAMEAGWMVREVGRQPWVVYGLLRTSDSASNLPVGSVLASLLVYIALYLALFVLFLVFARAIVRKGPDMQAQPPAPGEFFGPGRRPDTHDHAPHGDA